MEKRKTVEFVDATPSSWPLSYIVEMVNSGKWELLFLNSSRPTDLGIVEEMLTGLPLPVLLYVEGSRHGESTVVRGADELLAILLFVEGHLTLDDGFTFADLDPVDRDHLLARQIAGVQVSEEHDMRAAVIAQQEEARRRKTITRMRKWASLYEKR